MSGPTKPKAGLPAHRRMRHDRHFVDELSQRMGEGIGRMFRITAITANQDQPRSTLGDLSDLMASIQKHGVLEPLLVRRLPAGGSTPMYQLIAGERRFHAAIEAGLVEWLRTRGERRARARDLLGAVGLSDRARFRSALRATLAKGRRQSEAFDRLFDRFFAAPRRGRSFGYGDTAAFFRGLFRGQIPSTFVSLPSIPWAPPRAFRTPCSPG